MEERAEATSWGNAHEVAACAVEALWAILGRLEAGVPVVQVGQLDKPTDRGRFPRPEWIGGGDDGVIVVTSVREALQIMKKGGGTHGN